MSKLGDAIREGDALLPQTRNAYFEYDPEAYEATIVAGCAVGQACYAAGWRNTREQHVAHGGTTEYSSFAFPDENNTYVHCPHCDSNESDVLTMCTHLNDEHQLSSLQIADWVDKVMKEHGHE